MTYKTPAPQPAFHLKKKKDLIPTEERTYSQELDEWVIIRGESWRGKELQTVGDCVKRDCLCTDNKFHSRQPRSGDVKMYRSQSAAVYVAWVFGGSPVRVRRLGVPVQPKPKEEEPPLDWHPTCNGVEMMPTEMQNE